eukprot:3940654-Rhodomonas_salina.4
MLQQPGKLAPYAHPTRCAVLASPWCKAMRSTELSYGASSFNLLGKCLRLFAALEPVCAYPRLLRDI